MTTPNDITQSVLNQLVDQKIIKLLDPDSNNEITIHNFQIKKMIDTITNDALQAIKLINTHRPIEDHR